MSAEDLDTFKHKVNSWSKTFLKVYQTKHTTPYIHLLTNHIPEMLKLHGSLANFSQQGLEKLKDLINTKITLTL